MAVSVVVVVAAAAAVVVVVMIKAAVHASKAIPSSSLPSPSPSRH
jgi:hypothetical protein